MQPPTHHSASTKPPLADLHGPLIDWRPAPPPAPHHRPPVAAPTDQLAQEQAHAARVAAWLDVLRTCEAAYAQAAYAQPARP